MSDLAPDPENVAPDPFVLRAERRLRLLQELTDMSMELAAALKSRAVAECASDEQDHGKAVGTADTFARVTRAVRLGLALEAKTDRELRDLKAGIVAARVETRPSARKDRVMSKLDIIGLVGEVIDVEAKTEEVASELYEALEERLDEDEAYRNFESRPYRETVERICKDLRMNPDMSRWDGEGWIDDGPPGRPCYSVFNTPSAKPLLNDDDELLDAPSKPAAHDLE